MLLLCCWYDACCWYAVAMMLMQPLLGCCVTSIFLNFRFYKKINSDIAAWHQKSIFFCFAEVRIFERDCKVSYAFTVLWDFYSLNSLPLARLGRPYHSSGPWFQGPQRFWVYVCLTELDSIPSQLTDHLSFPYLRVIPLSNIKPVRVTSYPCQL